jgi:hypothetical protein
MAHNAASLVWRGGRCQTCIPSNVYEGFARVSADTGIQLCDRAQTRRPCFAHLRHPQAQHCLHSTHRATTIAPDAALASSEPATLAAGTASPITISLWSVLGRRFDEPVDGGLEGCHEGRPGGGMSGWMTAPG